MKGLFITATDTDVGKTVITGAIAAGLKARGINIGVQKPLASGCIPDGDGKAYSEDVAFLMKAAGIEEDKRELVNSFSLHPALTPAVAARQEGIVIDIPKVILNCQRGGMAYTAVLIEGVGGIAAPLWEDYLVSDMIAELKLPVLIVTRPDMGTINHTVLTVDYARTRGIIPIGIVVNKWNETAAGILETSNIEYIEKLTKVPIVGKFPISHSIDVQQGKIKGLAQLAEQYLDMELIIQAIGGP